MSVAAFGARIVSPTVRRAGDTEAALLPSCAEPVAQCHVRPHMSAMRPADTRVLNLAEGDSRDGSVRRVAGGVAQSPGSARAALRPFSLLTGSPSPFGVRSIVTIVASPFRWMVTTASLDGARIIIDTSPLSEFQRRDPVCNLRFFPSAPGGTSGVTPRRAWPRRQERRE